MKRAIHHRRRQIPVTWQILIALVVILIPQGCRTVASESATNTSLVRRYFEEGMNAGHPTVADEILSPSFVKHNNAVTSPEVGPDVLKRAIASHSEANAEYEFVIDDIVASGDKVAVRWTWTGVNKQYGKPRPVTNQGISIFRCENGKIVELWQAVDFLGYQKQLGFTLKAPSARRQRAN